MEAEAMGATFIVKPTSPEDIAAAILRTVLRDRALAAPPIRPPFERRRIERRVHPPNGTMPERRRADRRTDARLKITHLSVH
jgi:hypothetical protein